MTISLTFAGGGLARQSPSRSAGNSKAGRRAVSALLRFAANSTFRKPYGRRIGELLGETKQDLPSETWK
jgi:hypothetical protein